MHYFFNNFSALMAFGVFSALLSTYAFLPYIRDTLRRQTRPQRASWFIWSVLGSISLFSQIYEGATASLWFAGAQVGGTLVVCILSIWRGAGSFLNKCDACVLLGAAIGLVAWYATSSSVYALAISIGISLLGGSVTVMKAYRAPASETMTTWACSFLASGFALLAIGRVDPVLMAYPAYLLLLNGAIMLAIVLGRTVERTVAQRVDALRVAITPAPLPTPEPLSLTMPIQTENAPHLHARRLKLYSPARVREGARARLRA